MAYIVKEAQFYFEKNPTYLKVILIVSYKLFRKLKSARSQIWIWRSMLRNRDLRETLFSAFLILLSMKKTKVRKLCRKDRWNSSSVWSVPNTRNRPLSELHLFKRKTKRKRPRQRTKKNAIKPLRTIYFHFRRLLTGNEKMIESSLMCKLLFLTALAWNVLPLAGRSNASLKMTQIVSLEFKCWKRGSNGSLCLGNISP